MKHIISFVLVLLIGNLQCVEGLLDLTMVFENPVAAYNEEVTIKCVANNSYFRVTSFPFSLEADIGTGTNLTHMRRYGRISPENWPGRQIQLLDKAGPYKYGIFACGISDLVTGEETKAMGVVMSKNAQLFPTLLSTRASANESVFLRVVQLRPQPINDVFWVHLYENRQPRKVGQQQLRIEIPNVQPSDAGPYVVFHQTRDNFRRVFLQGLSRMVVRACEENKYGSDCMFECQACENGGVCDDVSGSCICPPGFMGELCEILCGPNKFGADCQYNCTDGNDEAGCRGKTFCLADPYGCTCATGYYGIICTLDCADEMYGESCNRECHCQGGKCNPYTGECPNSCSSGWAGVNCQKPCANGTFGPNCNDTCGQCLDGAICDRFTGACPISNDTKWSDEAVLNGTSSNSTIVCEIGFKPPLCKESCPVGTWGPDCDLECHCNGQRSCDAISGACPRPQGGADLCEPGWKGKVCNETCEPGLYGANCMSECGRCYNGSNCDPLTGNCVGCEAGFSPMLCASLCKPGSFGVNCSTPCNCANGSSCDPMSGRCEGFCQPGWTGVDCWEPCPSGTYGLNCSYECGNCLPLDEVVTCDPSFGHCEQGCTRSWSGRFCDEGILCAQNPCQNEGVCEQEGDIYRCECHEGYKGSHCEDLIPACDSSPCLNNATCVGNDTYITWFTCVCEGNFTGLTCSEAIIDEESTSAPEPPETSESRGVEMKYVIPIAAGVVILALLIAMLYKKYRSKPALDWGSVSIRPKTSDSTLPNCTHDEGHNQGAEDKEADEDEEEETPRDQELSPVTISVPDESGNPLEREITVEKEEGHPRPLQSRERIVFDKPPPIRKDGIAHVTPLHLSEHVQPSSDNESEFDVISKSSDHLTFNERMSKINDDSTAQDISSPFSRGDKVGSQDRVSKLVDPPQAPEDMGEKRVKLSRTSGEWKVNRPSTRVRLNSTALKRLSEISLHNFYSPRKSSVHPVNTTIPESEVADASLNRLSSQSAGGCALDGWDSNRRASNGSIVYGVTRRDSTLMVTSSRNVEEEFEMESRRGSKFSPSSKVGGAVA